MSKEKKNINNKREKESQGKKIIDKKGEKASQDGGGGG